jgi:pimeloyl-ACP methyl ester carboxylesterase
MALTERVASWERRGRREEFRGRSIHMFEQAGAEPLVVFLHGFPTSSFDFRLVIDRLKDRALLAFDSSVSVSPRNPVTTSTRSPGRPVSPKS